MNVQREGYPIVCAKCKKQPTVPFKPNSDDGRPLYCHDCYRSQTATTGREIYI